MKRTLRKIKKLTLDFLFYYPDIFIWKLAIRKLKRGEASSSVKGKTLLVPPASLNGSFGDELMVVSYLANFGKEEDVTILTKELIVRDDLLSGFMNVRYLGGFTNHSYFKSLSLLKDFSKVVVIGADILDGAYGYYHTLKYLRLIQLASKLKLETHFTGFSISKDLNEKLKPIFKEISQNTLLKARDLNSFKRLRAFIPEDGVISTSDMAFICPIDQNIFSSSLESYSEWCQVQKNDGRFIVAICPNILQSRKLGHSNYLKSLIGILELLSQKLNVSYVFLYHDIRRYDGHSDITISSELNDYFSKTLSTYFTEDVVNGLQLKRFIEYSDFTISGRMHFGISGIEMAKPMLGITYANKFAGMLKLFGINPDNCLVDYQHLDKGEDVVTRFIDNLNLNKGLINDNLEKVKNGAYLNDPKVLKLKSPLEREVVNIQGVD